MTDVTHLATSSYQLGNPIQSHKIASISSLFDKAIELAADGVDDVFKVNTKFSQVVAVHKNEVPDIIHGLVERMKSDKHYSGAAQHALINGADVSKAAAAGADDVAKAATIVADDAAKAAKSGSWVSRIPTGGKVAIGLGAAALATGLGYWALKAKDEKKPAPAAEEIRGR